MSDKGPLDRGMAGLQAAGEAVRQVGEQSRQAGAQAAGQAQDLAHEAMDRGTALAGAAAERAAAVAETQGVAGQLEDIARAVHRSGEQLEGHQDWVAGLVERGADELGALAETLRRNDLRGLMGELEGLARRQPALFAGASLAAGFALARVGRIAAAGVSKADLPSLPEVRPSGSSK